MQQVEDPGSDSELLRIKSVYGTYRDAGHLDGKWSRANRGNAAIIDERMRMLHAFLLEAAFPSLRDLHILEAGCGSGRVIGDFIDAGALPQHMIGIDLLEDRIAIARQQFPEVRFFCGSASAIDVPSGSQDLILFFTVFSSILDEPLQQSIAREAHRVLRSGGAVVWYDFMRNNPSNPHVRGITKKDIVRLFPDFRRQLVRVTLVPPLARHLGALTSLLYPLLAAVPLLRTHYLGLFVKE